MARGMDMQALRDRADRVRTAITVTSVIGRDVKLRRAGREQTGLCPFHTEKRDGAFMVNDDKGRYHCFACGADGDVIDYVMDRKGLTFMEALKELEASSGIDFSNARERGRLDAERKKREAASAKDSQRRREKAQGLWLNARPLLGTPAMAYLEGRGIDFAKLGRLPGAIRFRDDCWNGELRGELPAMVTAINALGGSFLGVHRTFLECVGGRWVKARLDKPKMVLGDFYGGAMPLWKGACRASLKDAEPGEPICLSEGIEDALSVAMAVPDRRTLAAISLDNIGNVALPPQAGDLTILCQRDEDVRARLAQLARAAGNAEEAQHHEQCAIDIEKARERAIGKQQQQARDQGSGRSVCLAWPSPGFKDFNDELRGVRMGGSGE